MQNKFHILTCAKNIPVALCISFVSCSPPNHMLFLSALTPAGASSKAGAIFEKPPQLAQAVSQIESGTKPSSTVNPFDNLRHEYLGYPKASPSSSYQASLTKLRKDSEPARNPFDTLRSQYLDPSDGVRTFPEEEKPKFSRRIQSPTKAERRQNSGRFDIFPGRTLPRQVAKESVAEERQRAFEQERQAIELERHKQLILPATD